MCMGYKPGMCRPLSKDTFQAFKLGTQMASNLVYAGPSNRVLSVPSNWVREGHSNKVHVELSNRVLGLHILPISIAKLIHVE